MTQIEYGDESFILRAGIRTGNLGKIIGALALAVIDGSSNYVSPQVTIDAIFLAFLFLAYGYAQAALPFLLLRMETKGRTIEETGHTLAVPDSVRMPMAK
jgi:hypothetical protein